MAWDSFVSDDGIYQVDWEVIGRMIRSYVRSCAMLEHSKTNEEFHWFGPTLHSIDVEWDKVKRQTDDRGEILLRDFYRNLQLSTQRQISHLAHWIELTSHNNTAFQRKMRDAQKQTMENIDKSVNHWGTAIEAARLTRDTSAEFLVVSATVVSGGAMFGALAVGSGLKATATAQDDPKATKKQIAVTFASEFAVGLIDVKGCKLIDKAAEHAAEQALLKAVGGQTARKLTEEAAKKGTKLGLAILWNQAKSITLEPGKAVIEGKTFKDGLLTGSLKATGGTHGEILKYLVLEDSRFPKLAAIADTAISIAADKAADSIKERGEREKEAPKLPKPADPSHPILDALAYDRKMIEQTAIRKIGSAAPRTGVRR
jgi:hypothetical protein